MHSLLVAFALVNFLALPALMVGAEGSVETKHADLEVDHQEFRITHRNLYYDEIRVPKSIETVVNDINESDVMVGLFLTEDETIHGFSWDERDLVTINAPGSVATFAQRITESGVVLGDFMQADGRVRGFIWIDGRFEIIDCPDERPTYVTGGTDGGVTGGTYRGVVVGNCLDDQGRYRGFQYIERAMSSIETPDDRESNIGFFVSDINNRQQLLGFFDGGESEDGVVMKPFWLTDQDGWILEPPVELNGAQIVSQPMALGDDGTILVQYFHADESVDAGYDNTRPSGYLLRDDMLSVLSLGEMERFAPIGMSKRYVVGYFDSENGQRIGFRAELPQ